MRRAWGAFGLIGLLGCSPRATTSEPSAELAPFRAFHGYARFGVGAPRLLRAGLPSQATAPLTLAAADRPAFSLSIANEGLQAVDGIAQDHARVYRGVAVDTDLAIGADAVGVEDVRILRSERAPRTFRWRIAPSAEVAEVRVREGRIEAIDRTGRVGLGTGVVRAVDSRGEQRDLALSATREGATFVVEARLSAEGLAFPVLVDPGWSTVPSMAKARAKHGAILLDDGRVLVVGGFSYDYSKLDSSAEVFEPTTNTWSAAGTLSAVRMQPLLVKGVAGEVLAIGGADSNTDGTQLVESWDPVSKTWSPRPPMSIYRNFASATKLKDGRILVAGGFSQYAFDALTTSELYDPAAKKWSPGPNLSGARAFHTAWSLPDGRVLVAGGARRWALTPRYSPEGGTELSSAEIYDPGTNAWAITGSLSLARFKADAAPGRTTDGKPLFVGGATAFGSVVSTVEWFDVAAGKWNVTGPLGGPRSPLVAAYAGGKFLAAAADLYVPSSKTAELCDLATGACTTSDSMGLARAEATATMLGDGTVLVAGGLPTIVATSGNVPYASAEIFGRKANGAACTSSAECVSSQCVDGVCCNSACAESCKACDVTGAVGTCTDVGGPPHGARSCAPYLTCVGGACASSCSTDSDCATTHFCAAGKCAAKKPAAGGCGEGRECASGHCADGVCCNAACGGQCEACDLPGKVGTCSPNVGAPRGTRAACTGVGAGTACGPTCDGVDPKACQFAKSTTPCSKNSCAAGLETHLSLCDGAGSCSDVPRTCAAYACDATACRNTCTTNGHCAAGYVCYKSACVPAGDLGEPCSPTRGCGAGTFCTDGVCCGLAACAAGSSCNAKGHEGTCTRNLGSGCTIDAECGSAHCVDGVCCESACGGQCEACDVPGKLGACLPIGGKPHGARPGCDDGGGETCKAAACDGPKDVTRCAGFANGPAVECGKAACADDTLTGAGKCDGFGACSAGEKRSCAPYGCGEGVCKTACTANTDCAKGNQCVGGVCLPGNRCSDDGLASVDPTGVRAECAPYRCRIDGNCGKVCTSSVECAPGNVCDGEKCAPTPLPSPEDSGGCAYGQRASGAWLSLAFALAAARSWRRSARRR